jgi:hypothetical protein
VAGRCKGGKAVLTRNHRQEAISRSYIQAVAGRCGMSCSFRDFDYGIDVTLHHIRRRGKRHYESRFKLDIQAKSTTAGQLMPEHVVYELSVTAHEDLRDPTAGTPRILVVLVLPEDEENWTSQTEEALLLRQAAYWLSLCGQPATGNRKSVQVHLPRGNLFTVASLKAILDKVSKREPLSVRTHGLILAFSKSASSRCAPTCCPVAGTSSRIPARSCSSSPGRWTTTANPSCKFCLPRSSCAITRCGWKSWSLR